MKPSKELLETLHKELARFNPEAPLTMLFDYVKIRFPTLDIQHIIKDILKLNINYMLHEDYGHYSYTEHYSLGDIFIYTSADEEKGVLLELKGRGCRQFESYYVLGNVIEPIGRDYLYSELVNPIFIKDGDNVKVKVAVKFIDNQTKATQVSQYELVLHKDSNWKIVG